jgi:RecG-like helicase
MITRQVKKSLIESDDESNINILNNIYTIYQTKNTIQKLMIRKTILNMLEKNYEFIEKMKNTSPENINRIIEYAKENGILEINFNPTYFIDKLRYIPTNQLNDMQKFCESNNII